MISNFGVSVIESHSSEIKCYFVGIFICLKYQPFKKMKKIFFLFIDI